MVLPPLGVVHRIAPHGQAEHLVLHQELDWQTEVLQSGDVICVTVLRTHSTVKINLEHTRTLGGSVGWCETRYGRVTPD